MKGRRTIVLGAGLTGLSFAYHHGGRVTVYEREREVGGLARTRQVDGCRFDYAPHLLHFRDSYVRDLVLDGLGVAMNRFEREAFIYLQGRLVPYPIELNLNSLGGRVRRECVEGLEKARKGGGEGLTGESSYKEYVLRSFGKGIGRHYLLPYNRKLWRMKPGKMTCEWMGYLPAVDYDRIKESLDGAKGKGYGYNAHFYYPREGGVGEVSRRLAERVGDIRLGREARRVDLGRRTVTFDDGEVARFDTLLSTVPLKRLLKMVAGDDGRHRRALHSTDVFVTNIVYEGEMPRCHWIYFPDRETPFYRASFPGNFFAGSAPGKLRVVTLEHSTCGKGVKRGALLRRSLHALSSMSFLRIGRIVRHDTVRIRHAYCQHDRQRTETVEDARRKLAAAGVVTTGRYGLWEYSSMEGAILHGRAAAEEMG